VCRLKEAFYGLKQALEKHLHQQGFKRGTINSNLHIKSENGNILIISIDDIIFGSDTNLLNQKFATNMQTEFEMSMLEELSFFLGL